MYYYFITTIIVILFFLRFTAAIFVRCFSLFLWFSCNIVSGSLVRCELLGAVKVKVHCGGRRWQTRHAEGGGCVADVQITYGSS